MPSRWSRRTFLTGLGVGATAATVPTPLFVPDLVASAATTPRSTGLTGLPALRAAMHVHGSWSEGSASWETQFAQAAAGGLDLLYMTDHDARAMAVGFASVLGSLHFQPSTTGSVRAGGQASVTDPVFSLSVESADGAPATETLTVLDRPDARNFLRTSISGQSIDLVFGACALVGGATFDVSITLSKHPARASRPSGTYRLLYRFGGSLGISITGGGLVGVVGRPVPTAGATVRLDLVADVSAVWPDLLAMDNAFQAISFTVRSPRSGSPGSVVLPSATIVRARSTAAAVIADQEAVQAAYQGLHPQLAVRRTSELSGNPKIHFNYFGAPQWLPDYASMPTSPGAVSASLAAQTHARGALLSYNHPFGDDGLPLLSAADQDAKRRAVFSAMRATDAYGADILEVGYRNRGHVDTTQHLALWDTFSRAARFLTGNGVNDEHNGAGWGHMVNGFLTGIWAPSVSDPDVTGGLRSGRCYTAHLGDWRGAAIDMLVDDTVPMGAVSVSDLTTRQLTVSLANLPASSTVQLVQGPVDDTGSVDPGTSVVRSWTTVDFAGGPVQVPVEATSPVFYRVQVVSATGRVIGSGNPIWLLKQAPRGGVPAARQVTEPPPPARSPA